MFFIAAPVVEITQAMKSTPPPVLKSLPPPPTKKPPTAIIPPQPKPSPVPTMLPKLPPLRPTSTPVAVTKPQVISKPVTPRTVTPNPKPPENILKSTESTDSSKPTNSSDVLPSIIPTPVVKVSHTTKEKTIIKDNKTTSRDKTGFVLPTPKPIVTKPGIIC